MRPLLTCALVGAAILAAAVGVHTTAQVTSPSAGTVSGVVLAPGATTPVGGAIVSLEGRALARAVARVTKADGTFSFDGLPAGEYQLSARKAPYLTMAYGARRFGRSGTPLRLGDGQQVSGLALELGSAGVVSGDLRDERGGVLADLVVSAFRVGADGAAVTAATTTSDDNGAYRLFGLEPGRYLVSATRRFADGGAFQDAAEDELDQRLAALERFGLRAPRASAVTTRPVVRGLGPTFYPGTSAVDEASLIDIAAGTFARADLVVAPMASGLVEGVVRTDDGTPLATVSVMLEQVGPSLPPDFTARPRAVVRPTAGDPRFGFAGVVPGRYLLTARAEGLPGGPPARSAALEVRADGSDVSGVTLTLGRGIRLVGTTATGTGVNQRSLETVRLSLTMVATETGSRAPSTLRVAAPRNIPLSTDGRFDVSGVAPGAYTISANGLGNAWLRSATVNGPDALDVPVLLREQTEPYRVILTFSDRLGELSGLLTTPTGAAAVDFTVVAFTTDAQLWRPDARRVRSARPSSAGRYVIPDLPGGDYFVAAMTDVAPEDLADPAFLAELSKSAVKVTLPEGRPLVQDFRITALPQ